MKWVLLLGLVVLTTSCSPEAAPAPSPGGSALATTSPVSTPTLSIRSPVATPSSEIQPPVDDGASVPGSPAARARVDLARRVQIDAGQIDVMNVEDKEADEALVACLGDGADSQSLLRGVEEVTWVTLAIGGKRYQYVVLQDLTIYCDR